MNFTDIIKYDSLFDDVLSPFLSGKRERILLGKDLKRRGKISRRRCRQKIVGSSPKAKKRERERKRERKTKTI